MKILALDLATKTGWATYIYGHIDIGTADFGLKRGESPGMRFLRCRSWLREMHKIIGKFTIVAYEQPHQRGGHPTQVAMGLLGEVLSFAAETESETMSVHTTQLKKWATGIGNASKDDMVNEAKRRGHIVGNDDEADAVLLLEYVLADLNISSHDTARSNVIPFKKSKLVRRK